MADSKDTDFDDGRARRELEAWDAFRDRMQSLHTLDDARALLDRPPDDEGHPYYHNLAEFLLTFAILKTTTRPEREFYLQFLERLDAAGSLTRGSTGAMASLRHSLGR